MNDRSTDLDQTETTKSDEDSNGFVSTSGENINVSDDIPLAYKSIDKGEDELHLIVNRFHHYYLSMCPDRVNLLLLPLNEYGVPKFVCRTLCPFLLTHADYVEWRDISAFVSDCIKYEPFKDFKESIAIPKILHSPEYVLRTQKANSFELSTLLCSILIARGYDAYVVSGYAAPEVCLCDRRRENAYYSTDIFLEKFEDSELIDSTSKLSAWNLSNDDWIDRRSSKKTSSFLVSTAAEALNARRSVIDLILRAFRNKRRSMKIDSATHEKSSEADEEEYFLDPLNYVEEDTEESHSDEISLHRNANASDGRDDVSSEYSSMIRVHSWVLLKENSNCKLLGSTSESHLHFIEPTTGLSHSIDEPTYYGIESLWNNRNYWVNLQICENGCADMRFELNEFRDWEPIFRDANDILSQSSYNDGNDALIYASEGPVRGETRSHTDDSHCIDIAKSLLNTPAKKLRYYSVLLTSWLKVQKITEKQLQARFPEGNKTEHFYKCIVQKFGSMSRVDGLMLRIVFFSDENYRNMIREIFCFKDRKDLLSLKEIDHENEKAEEHFWPGRKDHLKSHYYFTSEADLNTDAHRKMYFYHRYRLDNLYMRESSGSELIEHYKNRIDNLRKRSVKFDTEMRSKLRSNMLMKLISMIVENYDRNSRTKSNENVELILYEPKIPQYTITYFSDELSLVPITRQLLNADEAELLTNEQCFDICLSSRMTCRQHTLNIDEWKSLLDCVKQSEIRATEEIRVSEKDVYNILKRRIDEKQILTLQKKLTQAQLSSGRWNGTDEIKLQTEETDYLLPWLIRFNAVNTEQVMNKRTATLIKNAYLNDLRSRQLGIMNYMERRLQHELNRQSTETIITTIRNRIKETRRVFEKEFSEAKTKVENDPRLLKFLAETHTTVHCGCSNE